MHVRVDPDTIIPALILFLMGVYFLSIGLDTLRNGKQSKFKARDIALGRDRPILAYNPETRTVLIGTLPDHEGEEG